MEKYEYYVGNMILKNGGCGEYDKASEIRTFNFKESLDLYYKLFNIFMKSVKNRIDLEDVKNEKDELAQRAINLDGLEMPYFKRSDGRIWNDKNKEWIITKTNKN